MNFLRLILRVNDSSSNALKQLEWLNQKRLYETKAFKNILKFTPNLLHVIFKGIILVKKQLYKWLEF